MAVGKQGSGPKRVMANTRPLARPPIREAIIEIRSEPCDLSRVTAFRDAIAADFPRSQPFRLASAALRIPEERRGRPDLDAAASQIGWRCESADGREVALIRTDGFSVATVGGYPGWEAFSERYLSLYADYRRCVAPLELERVGVRYVNEIRLPISPSFDFDDYLTAAPRAPAGFPQAFFDFLMQMTLPSGVDGTTVNVTQATDSAGRSEAELPLIIDIDVGTRRPCAADPELAEQLAHALAQMRDIKNRVFFGLITEELAETYQ
ncbi:MAG: TIGR04255 family protein [Burkholderiales bacterium]|nr:MAG: TIGR04255 family protein [Burkholderiales bacterium]